MSYRHRYATLDHFRAPYRDGLVGCGLGAVDQATIASSMVSIDGIAYWRADVASRALTNLSRVTNATGTTVAGVVEQLQLKGGNFSVDSWLKAAMASGGWILAETGVVFPGGVSPDASGFRLWVVPSLIGLNAPVVPFVSPAWQGVPVLASPGDVWAQPGPCPTEQFPGPTGECGPRIPGYENNYTLAADAGSSSGVSWKIVGGLVAVGLAAYWLLGK